MSTKKKKDDAPEDLEPMEGMETELELVPATDLESGTEQETPQEEPTTEADPPLQPWPEEDSIWDAAPEDPPPPVVVLDPEGEGTSDTPEPPDGGLDAAEAAELPAFGEESPPAELAPVRRKAKAKAAIAPDSAPRRLSDMNLKDLDRYLTPEEQNEWNAVYASYRSRSVLTGTVMGVDKNTFDVKNRETGLTETKTLYSAVIVGYRVKILIPEDEMWLGEARWPGHVVRGMVGSEMDYVILEIDREGGCAIGSRRLALTARRRYFNTAPKGHEAGEALTCKVMTVGPSRCLVDCNGYDISLPARLMTYTSVPDLREKYHPGQELRCVLTKYDPAESGLGISVKLATANPFDGADQRHPVGSRRQAVITGKYSGGVFVTLPDELTLLCGYSRLLRDEDFQIGDRVIVAVEHFNFERKLIAGRIMSKLW